MKGAFTSSDLVFNPAAFRHVPLFDQFDAVAQAGFRGIAVQPNVVWALEEQGTTVAEIVGRVADAGLILAEIECTACWMDRQRDESDDSEMARLMRTLSADRVLETAACMGARSVTAVDLSPSPTPIEQAAEGFAQLCDDAAQHGLRVQLEFVPVGGVRTLSDAWAIVSAAGRSNGGLLIDAWHIFRSGSTLEELAAIPGDRIFAVQLCDAPAIPADDMWAELMTARLLPGEGGLDVVGLIRTLDRIGSVAPIGVEVLNDRQLGQDFAEVVKAQANAAQTVLDAARRP